MLLGAIAVVLLGLAAPVAPAPSVRALSFEDRVAAHRAIEGVYRRHRTGSGASAPSRSLAVEMASESGLRERVAESLRMSKALEDFWQRPIRADQLQSEIARMARDTRKPEILAELFAAVDNDPFLIAECLARPALAERLLRTWWAADPRYRSAGQDSAVPSREPDETRFAAWWGARRVSLSTTVAAPDARYVIPESTAAGCNPDSWRPTAHEAPDGIVDPLTVWTGSEMIVWDEEGGELGYRYDPSTDTWRALPRAGAPEAPRYGSSAVWTGYEMIVWGGEDNYGARNTGARYDPSTDSWSPTGTDLGALEGRAYHSAVWTGSRMIVWGGRTDFSTYAASGASYDPVADSWSPTSTGVNTPAPRMDHSAVWTGSQMIVWGGYDGGYLGTGGRYDPSTDSWLTLSSSPGTPSARRDHSAVWTGGVMIVWGGRDGSFLGTGARYDPQSDSWTATSPGPAPRAYHSAVWTGTELIVWGGWNGTRLGTGARYDPLTNQWQPTGAIGAVPAARNYHAAVWTGTEMIVWGGVSTEPDSGGRYDPATGGWVATRRSTVNPDARYSHVAVWTGSEMIVWGGWPPTVEGGRYDPATDLWRPMSTGSGVPEPRQDATVVWTGTEMIVWGGVGENGTSVGTGGRYDPATDTWRPTAVGPDSPSPRYWHTAVWTGDEMIVFGGQDALGFPSFSLRTGGRYDPFTDTWRPTPTSQYLPRRSLHVAAWTGAAMIVWGGQDAEVGSGPLRTGNLYDPYSDGWVPIHNAPSGGWRDTAVWTGNELIIWGNDPDDGQGRGFRYDPNYDAWSWVASANAPEAGDFHSAIWTGDEMIVWGGQTDRSLNTGGRYDPITDTWTATPLSPDTPTGRDSHSAVYTEAEMIVWGGWPLTATGAALCAPCTSATWYRDSDHDGYGDASNATVRCATVPGYVATPGDCDDVDPEVGSWPYGAMAIRIDKAGPATARLSWIAAPLAFDDYDVVRGSLNQLRESGGDFAVSSQACLADGLPSTTLDDPDIPAVGQGFWYLVRGSVGGQAYTFDSPGCRQISSRDAGIGLCAQSLSAP